MMLHSKHCGISILGSSEENFETFTQFPTFQPLPVKDQLHCTNLNLLFSRDTPVKFGLVDQLCSRN